MKSIVVKNFIHHVIQKGGLVEEDPDAIAFKNLIDQYSENSYFDILWNSAEEYDQLRKEIDYAPEYPFGGTPKSKKEGALICWFIKQKEYYK